MWSEPVAVTASPATSPLPPGRPAADVPSSSTVPASAASNFGRSLVPVTVMVTVCVSEPPFSSVSVTV